MPVTDKLQLTQIISKRPQQKLMVHSSVAKALQQFLSEACQNNVLVINTERALDVYHFESCKCSELVKDAFLIRSGKDEGFYFKDFVNEQEVVLQFEQTLTQLAKYPKLFLAYGRRLAFRIKRERINQQIVWKLIDHFEETIKKLEATGKMPHIRKIKEISASFKEVNALSDHEKTIKRLLNDLESNQILN